MELPNTVSCNDSRERYRKKWQDNFDPFYQNEELDYEYAEDDPASAFPFSYSSFLASSSASSRSSFPIGIIDLSSEEEDHDKKGAHKKLNRNFSELSRVQKSQNAPSVRKSWRKNVDITGIVKRWRIRSLDKIFMSSKLDLLGPRPPETILVKDSLTSAKSNRPRKVVDMGSDMSIVVNNDLCSTSSASCDRLLEPLPDSQDDAYNCNSSMEMWKTAPFSSTYGAPVINFDEVSDITIITSKIPPFPHRPITNERGSYQSDNFVSVQTEVSKFCDISVKVNVNEQKGIESLEHLAPYEKFCPNFINGRHCHDSSCPLAHGIPRSFAMSLNCLDVDVMMKSYRYVKGKPLFRNIVPYYAVAASLKMKREFLLDMIDDVLPVDMSLVDIIIKAMNSTGLRFQEVLDLFISRGVCDQLNDYLLEILTRKNLDNWDLILKLVHQRISKVPGTVMNSILSLALCQSPIDKMLCTSINRELFEAKRADTGHIPGFLYNSFLQTVG